MTTNFISIERISEHKYKVLSKCIVCEEEFNYLRKTYGTTGRRICDKRACFLELKRKESENSRTNEAIIDINNILEEKDDNNPHIIKALITGDNPSEYI